jgi:hypothetical protein
LLVYFILSIYLHSNGVVVTIDALPQAFSLELFSADFAAVAIGLCAAFSSSRLRS